MGSVSKIWNWFLGLSRKNKAIFLVALLLVAVKINVELTPQWKTEGYQTYAGYEEAKAGGFESSYEYAEAKKNGIQTKEKWNAYLEAQQLAQQKRQEQERTALEEAKRLADKKIIDKALQLKNPDWVALEVMPKAIRGFKAIPSGCGVQHNESMNVYTSFATIYGENAIYVVSYTKPGSGSVYENAAAWNNPQKNRKIAVLPLKIFEFKANDGEQFILLLNKHKKISGHEVSDIFGIENGEVTKRAGYLRSGKVIDSMTKLRESLTGAPGSTLNPKDVGKIGINDEKLDSEKCSLKDYDDIADDVFYLDTGGTITLRKLAEQF